MLTRCVACVLLATAAALPQDSLTPPSHRVHAVRYATIAHFPVSSLVAGADPSRRAEIAMTIWLLRGNGRTVLFDAGFHGEQYIAQWKPKDYVRPDAALAPLKVAAADVTDIIVSHVHWDHLDGASLFPRARVWIQQGEFDYYVDENGKPRNRGIDARGAALLADLRRAGRLQLVDGDAREILPGITVYTGGRHTYASQHVGVRTAHGVVVLASDNVYLYENLDRGVPIAQTLDADANLAAQRRMRTIASDPTWIVPGHDQLVFTRFPAVTDGIVAIPR